MWPALILGTASLGHAETAALVIDSESGAVHYAYRIDAQHPPASLTKMMTVYMAFEALRDGQLKPGARLKVSPSAARQKPSRLGLRPGSTIRIEEAILALVTKSANDASVVIAEAIAGSETEFATRMTARARALGMTGTVFRNASGLHHPAQTTTARDMARLAKALIRDFPVKYGLFSRPSFVWRGRRYRNHNSMLASYDGADGVKTGYIRQSGYNLVASALRGDRRVIGVVLGGRSIRHRDWMMETMLDYGFRTPDASDPRAEQDLPYAEDLLDDEYFDARLAEVIGRASAQSVDTPAGDTPQAGEQAHADGEWSIQVGAYRTASPANEAALRAASRIPALLGNAKVVVTQIVQNGQRMFRARLTGLSEGEARTSCRQLAEHEIPCMAVAATGEFRTDSPFH